MTVGDADAALLRALRDIERAKDGSQIADALVGYANIHGLTHAMIALPRKHDELDGNRDILGVTPPSMTPLFAGTTLLTQDGDVAEANENRRPIIWNRTSPDAATTSDTQGLRSVFLKLGLNAGVIIPSFGPGGMVGVVILAGAEREHAPDEIALAHLKVLAVYAFDRAIDRHRAQIRETYNLSDREYECLQWCAAGKTDWEIGQILSISPKTVNYHIENAKRKMGVQTRVQAVVTALRVGGIEC